MKNSTLTKDDIIYCETTLTNWKVAMQKLTSPNVSALDIQKLIQYEINTKKRKDILNRLVGRYFKLLRQREWQKIVDYIDNERNPNRKTLN